MPENDSQEFRAAERAPERPATRAKPNLEADPTCKCEHAFAKHAHGRECLAMIEVIRHGVTQKVFCPCSLFRRSTA